MGSAIVVILLVVCAFAPIIAPHDPVEQNLEQRLGPPSFKYPMGTDNLGRCIFSRIVYGARVSLSIALIVVLINSISGVLVGLLSGFFGGILDSILMRLVDIVLTLPGIILALLIAGILGPSLLNVMLALTIVGWTGYARVVRGSVMSLRKKEFIEAETALGANNPRKLFLHILPNAFAPVIVMVTLGIGYVILATSALSFIGLGAQPPIAEWGAMLNGGKSFIRTAPHLMIFPGLAIMLSVMGFNLLGNGLRDILLEGT